MLRVRVRVRVGVRFWVRIRARVRAMISIRVRTCEVHHVLVEVVGVAHDGAAGELLAEGGVALEADAADDHVRLERGAVAG